MQGMSLVVVYLLDFYKETPYLQSCHPDKIFGNSFLTVVWVGVLPCGSGYCMSSAVDDKTCKAEPAETGASVVGISEWSYFLMR